MVKGRRDTGNDVNEGITGKNDGKGREGIRREGLEKSGKVWQ